MLGWKSSKQFDDRSFFVLKYSVCFNDLSIKIAVSLAGICNCQQSHLCLASFPLSHSPPNIAAGTSFSARCTSCTLETVFLLGTLPCDRLLFVLSLQLKAWENDNDRSRFLIYRSQNYYIWLTTFECQLVLNSYRVCCFSQSHKYTTARGKPQCSFWLLNYTLADSASFFQGGTIPVLQALASLDRSPHPYLII